MGKVIFRDTGFHKPSEAKITGKIRMKKAKTNFKLNLIIGLTLFNTALILLLNTDKLISLYRMFIK